MIRVLLYLQLGKNTTLNLVIFPIIPKKVYCNFSKLSVHFNYALQHLEASKNGRNVTIYIKSKLENMCGHNVRPFSMTSVLNK